jgi:hypothetical protein
MERWHVAHPQAPSTKRALKGIHKKIHEARKAYLEDKDYFTPLAKAKEMIEDLFICKAIDIKAYVPEVKKLPV